MPSDAARRRSAMVPVLLVLLLVEFLLGVWVNLWIAVPKDHPGFSPDYFSGVVGGVPWALVHGPLMLALHVGLGIVVSLMSVAILVRAIRLHGRLLWPILGAFGVTAAAGNGASFLNYGLDVSSLLMSVAFAIAILSYAMLLGEPS